MEKNNTNFDYKDINLIPRMCIVNSRDECDTSINIYNYKFNLPVVPANMECVINEELAIKLAQNNFFYIMHRFHINIIDFVRTMKSINLIVSISIGVNQDSYDLINKLQELNLIPEFITIDIAHGHSIKMESMIKYIKNQESFNKTKIIAGNISTREAVQDLAKWGADIIKVGIGPGCLKSDTRILMADGTYKNICDINVGDYVINMNGDSVKVKNVIDNGKKYVFKFKNNLYYDYTYATEEHNFYIGDLSLHKPNVISSSGIAKLLNKQSKQIPKQSKYKWKELSDINKDTMFALMPKTIKWNLVENFKIDLAKYIKRAHYNDNIITTNNNNTFNRYIESNYDLGYIFGTFLGDGTSRIEVNQKTNCESGECTWTFGENEIDICEKLKLCIKNVLNIDITYKKVNNKAVHIVALYNKCMSKLFLEFGKKINKHLPKEYYCKNINYIQGLFDGLIDSDGHIDKLTVNKEKKIYKFINTSKQLIELFQWCCFSLNISFTASHEKGTSGGLKGITDKSIFNDFYKIKTHTNNRFTKSYLYSNILEYEKEPILAQTYDLEIDCPTHSFIANNMIVHNSACTTYLNTGFGSRDIQAYCVKECCEEANKYNILVIADGGISQVCDIAKSLVMGAKLVMIGGMFTGFEESPEKIVTGQDGKLYQEFFGSASEHSKTNTGDKKTKNIEGTIKLVPFKNKSIFKYLDELRQALQSAISYGGGKELSCFKEVKYIIKV